MNPAREAAALAGIAENTAFSTNDRLAAAKKALDFYIDQQDQLWGLLEFCDENAADSGPSGMTCEAIAKKLLVILYGGPQ